MKKKALYIILAIIVLIAVYYIVGPFGQQADEGLTPEGELPTEKEFDSKIVYTTDTSLDAGPFKADCQTREGVFNECGTTCAPDVEICAEVCAYTCDLTGEGAEESATSTEGDVSTEEESVNNGESTTSTENEEETE